MLTLSLLILQTSVSEYMSEPEFKQLPPDLYMNLSIFLVAGRPKILSKCMPSSESALENEYYYVLRTDLVNEFWFYGNCDCSTSGHLTEEL